MECCIMVKYYFAQISFDRFCINVTVILKHIINLNSAFAYYSVFLISEDVLKVYADDEVCL